MTWACALVPFFFVSALWFIDLLWITMQSLWRRTWRLSTVQWQCLAGYFASLCCSTVSALLLATLDETAMVCLWSRLLFLIAVVVFVISALHILLKEMDDMLSARGYCDPLPIAKTDEGWTALQSPYEHSLLLGTISAS